MGLASTRCGAGGSRRSRVAVSESETPRNNLAWRVAQLERKVDTLEAGQPAVMAERVATLSRRMGELRDEVREDMASLREGMRERDEARAKQIRGFQRIFVAVFSGVGIAVAGTVIALVVTGGQA